MALGVHVRDWSPRGRCVTGKVRYGAKLEAQAELDRATAMAAAGADWRHERRLYLCPFCLGWHLTSKPR